MNISKLKLELRRTVREQEKCLNVLMGRKPLLKGGVYKTKTKCGKKGCKCEREGKLHIVWRLYRTKEGKKGIKTLKVKEISEYEKLTKNYQKFRRARANFVKMHRNQLELINLIEKALTKENI